MGDYGTRFTKAELEQIAAENATSTPEDETAEWTVNETAPGEFTRELAEQIREESERTRDDPYPPGTQWTRPNAPGSTDRLRPGRAVGAANPLWGKRGNTRAWARLRAHYEAWFPLPCWRCGRLIRPGEAWVLGHLDDRWRGGGDDRLAPEHNACSLKSAGAASAAARRARRAAAAAGRPVPASAATARTRQARARRAARYGPSREW
jgi:hypothetical protein